MECALRNQAGRLAAVLMAGASLAACASLTSPKYSIQDQGVHAKPAGDPTARGTNAPYQVGGIWYVPHDQPHYDETGIASWYGDAFNLKATANGETFDMNQFSAAHTTLPLPSMVEVTNLDNGRKLTLRVNDRGPFVGGRIIDLSHAAAQELGYDRAGTAHVRVRYLGPAPLGGPDMGLRYARSLLSPGSSPPGSPTARRPADEVIFEEASAAPKPVTPLVRPPQAVSISALAPLAPARPTTLDAPRSGATSQGFRIQAGAFSDQENAKRAAAQLSSNGAANIEPFDHGGVTYYRVYLPGPSDEAEAYAVRDRVAASGFADARVVGP